MPPGESGLTDSIRYPFFHTPRLALGISLMNENASESKLGEKPE